jgi:conjugative relaxase-like TrwC/TraI family protein
MLSLANVSPQQGATYYKTENYYSKADAVGYSKWAGSAAERSGMSGAVDHHTFTRLLAGKHPTIEVGGTKANRRAGLDMTFSAPKSVSIQALVFGDTRLVEAHRRAVDEALRFVEMHYALYRDGPKEARVKMKGTGLLIAQFEHDTSRLKDPQLHTHNVVLNRVSTQEGMVKALFADSIYAHGQLIGAVYRNELAREVKALGYGVRALPKGLFELEGMPFQSLERFSKRRAQIEEMKPASYRHTRELVLKDRQAKDGPQLREDLVHGWRAEAKMAGVKAIGSLKCERSEKAIPLQKIMDDALANASLRSAVFRREDVLRGALEIGLGRFPLAVLEKEFDESIGTKVLRTKSEGVFTSLAAVERDLDTRAMVDAGLASHPPIATHEAAQVRLSRLTLLDSARAAEALALSESLLRTLGAPTPSFQVERAAFERALNEGRRLSLMEITKARASLLEDIKALPKAQQKDARVVAIQAMAPLERAFLAPTRGQQDAIEATLTSSDQVILWQGVAGSGKTFSMRQIVEEASNAGIEVRGLAPSAAAALQLKAAAGIEATTLQGHLLVREERNARSKLWVVDEAGMVSAADMHALLRKAQKANARVLIVGDVAQLSPIDAGNPFSDLQKNAKTTLVRLDESLRQKDPELLKAVKHMNAGEMVKAIDVLESAIREVKGQSTRTAAAVHAFLEAPKEEREGILMLARTNETKTELTQKIREGLIREGVLANPVRAETFERVDIPEPKRAYASSYIEGALLVPNRRYRSLGLEKDAFYEIVESDPQRNVLKVRQGETSVTIDLARLQNFSMYTKATIEIAEGDKMIWNRNVKGRGQFNNHGFTIEKIRADGIQIRTDSNETRILSARERQHMEHAWALTLYKAQGRTTDRVIQIADSQTDARDVLVGVTRATQAASIFAPSKSHVVRAAQKDETKAIAANVVSPESSAQRALLQAEDSTTLAVREETLKKTRRRGRTL